MSQESVGTESGAETDARGQRETQAIAPGHAGNETDGRSARQGGYFSKPKNWVALLTLIAVSIYAVVQ